ncbi:MAG TPA: hypothetical protein VGE98_05660, partial [Thermoanaerobaculia bacterium]
LNRKAICEGCRQAVEQELARRGGGRGFLKAAGAGFLAAVAGSIVYYAVREISGYELSLISILVGWGVGRAVHWGSRGRGGWVYQSLAVFLTYMAIVSTYVPMIVKTIEKADAKKAAVSAPAAPGGKEKAAPAKAEAPPSFTDFLLALGALFLFLMIVPFLGGLGNIIGLLIIAFGLYQAWKMNRRAPVEISGPYQVGAAPPVSP